MKLRTDKLGPIWELFEEVQIEIDLLSQDDLNTQLIECDSFENNYFSTCIKTQIERVEKELFVSTSTTAAGVSNLSHCEISLPSIKFRTFNGRFHEWVEF